MKNRVLIIYASSYGQTARIARRLSDVMEQRGIGTELVDARSDRILLSRGHYDAIVVGSSLIARGQQPAIRTFVNDNLETLNESLSVFFQVSASAGSVQPAGRAAAERVLHDFLARVGWQPQLVASIAGAVNYTRYNPLLRWYMKRASKRGGGSTDTSRDHEYTDWSQVERFAIDIAQAVREHAESAEPVSPAVGR